MRDVIKLAEAIRDYWDAELPKRHPRYPIVRGGEDSGPPPPEKAALRTLLYSLPEEMIYGLVTIMCIGRGDFGTEDLNQSLHAVKDTFEEPEYAIAQMMEYVPLAEYLSDGMAKLKKNKINVDRMFAQTSGTPAK